MNEKFISYTILVITITFNLYFLYPELSSGEYDINDYTLHYSVMLRVKDAFLNFENPLDHWLSYYGLGFPFLHYYQPLPYIFVVLLYFIFLQKIPLLTIFLIVRYLFLVFFPLSVYIGARKFNFPKITSAFIALCSCLVSSPDLYGINYGSYIWRGQGLYSQLFAMFFMPLAFSYIYRTIHLGEKYSKSAILTSVVFLSHLIYGYIILLSTFFFLVTNLNFKIILLRIKRLVILFLIFFFLTSFFTIPVLLNNNYVNHSIWEDSYKWDSYGMKIVIKKLINGELFDQHREPILTILLALGFAISLLHRKEEYKLFAYLFIFWLLIYFGRATWGPLFNLLPISKDIHFHRVIGGVQIIGVFLAGITLGTIWEGFNYKKFLIYKGIVIIVTLLILYPIYKERIDFYTVNKKWGENNKKAVLKEIKNVKDTISYLKTLPSARVYPGLAAGWGNRFKIGSLPFFAFLGLNQIDAVAFLYHAMSLNSDIMVLFNENIHSHYDLFNIRYVVSEANRKFKNFVHPLKVIGNFKISTVETSGFFSLVDSNIAYYGKRDSLYKILSEWLNSELLSQQEFISIFFKKNFPATSYKYKLTEDGDITLPRVSKSIEKKGTIVYEKREGDIFKGEFIVNKECFLLFKMTYHPNWHIYIDGKEEEKVMLSPSFIGVKVSEGKHNVVCEYRSSWVKKSLLIVSFLSLLFLLSSFTLHQGQKCSI